MTRIARLPLRRRVRERDEGGTTSRPQPLPPGKAARQVAAPACWREDGCTACGLARGCTVACTCVPRRRGRLTSRARKAMAKTIARVPRRTRPMTRMLSSIAAREAAVLRADAFLRPPGTAEPAPGRAPPRGALRPAALWLL